MTDSQYTHISIVLDRSGSMTTIQTDTIGGFNQFLEAQKALPGKATLTLYQFDNQFDYICQFAPLREVSPLTKETYVPRASTALLDAIGNEINATGRKLVSMPEAQRPGKVLFVIITDGCENASQRFTHAQVSEMISTQRDTYHWEFVFLGANQDAIATAAAMNISRGNTVTFAANAAGTASAYHTVTKLSNTVRSAGFVAGSAAASNLVDDEDRKWQEEAGVQPSTPTGGTP